MKRILSITATLFWLIVLSSCAFEDRTESIHFDGSIHEETTDVNEQTMPQSIFFAETSSDITIVSDTSILTTTTPEATTLSVTTTVPTTTAAPTTVTTTSPTTTTVPTTTTAPTTTVESTTTAPPTTTAPQTSAVVSFTATEATTTVATTGSDKSTSKAEKILNSAELTSFVTDYDPLTEITEQVLSEITTDDMSTYEKVKSCYDYLINECEYDENTPALFQTFDDMGYGLMINAYDMLKEHKGVCHHYAAAFVALTRYIGLESYYQLGQTHKASGGFTGHTWVVIIIDGVEYVFDPQVEDNIANGGKIQYLRFCKTYEEVKDKYMFDEKSY